MLINKWFDLLKYPNLWIAFKATEKDVRVKFKTERISSRIYDREQNLFINRGNRNNTIIHNTFGLKLQKDDHHFKKMEAEIFFLSRREMNYRKITKKQLKSAGYMKSMMNVKNRRYILIDKGMLERKVTMTNE